MNTVVSQPFCVNALPRGYMYYPVWYSLLANSCLDFEKTFCFCLVIVITIDLFDFLDSSHVNCLNYAWRNCFQLPENRHEFPEKFHEYLQMFHS